MVGKIERVDLREVWEHEALHFTPWLRENIEVLGEELGIDLSDAESEQSAGDFSVDIIAEDADGNPVIIENQLDKSNHDHLGKLITYLTAIEAKTAIWIVADPRPEHVKAITWLNESSSAAFFLLKVEAIRIDDSPAAPLLTLIVGPSDEATAIGVVKQGWNDREKTRHRFWTQLLERAKKRTQLHANIGPGRDSWIGASAGRSGLGLHYCITQQEARAELWLHRNEGAEENARIFDELHQHRDEIEASFGDSIDWEPLEHAKSCRIAKRLYTGGYTDSEDKWPAIQDAMIDAMIRLEAALRPHIDALDI